MSEVIAINNLNKSYGEKSVLVNFSLSLPPVITFMTGPSGCGKTTLLRLLAGLEYDNNGVQPLPKSISVSAVFQEDRLFEQFSVSENLKLALGKHYDYSRAKMLLSELGLNIDDKNIVSSYSGGMRRRVALARSLLMPADLYLMDEPFTGLDIDSVNAAMAQIRLFTEGKPVLLVTHNLPERIIEKDRIIDFQR